MEECLFSALESLRDEVKQIDDNIVKLIAHRIDIVREIGKIKHQIDLPIKNKNVEHVNLARLTNLANEMKISSKFINAIYSLVITNAIQVQEEDRKSCQYEITVIPDPFGMVSMEATEGVGSDP